MNIEEFKIILAKNMDSKSYKKGKSYFSAGLVSDIKENIDKEFNGLDIYGKVISESTGELYDTNISIDLNNKGLVYTNCKCLDFEKKSEDDNLYFCKHLAATGLAYLERMNKKVYEDKFSIWKNTSYLNKERTLSKTIEETENIEIGKSIIDFIKTKENKLNLINIDIYIRMAKEEYRENNYYEVEFKVGLDKMYVLKDIEEFIRASEKGRVLEFGKNFTYDGKNHNFSEKDEEIINFIKEQVELNSFFSGSYRNYGFDVVKGKLLRILPCNIKRFLKLIKHKRVNFIVNGEESTYSIREENMPLEIEITESIEGIQFKDNMEFLPIKLDKDGETYIYNRNIYLINKSQRFIYSRFYEEFKKSSIIDFKKEQLGDIFTYIVPSLENGAKEIKIEPKLLDNIVREPLKIGFYIDKNKSSIWISMKLIYGKEQFDYVLGPSGDNIIIRNAKEEEEAKNLLEEYKFFIERGKFYFKGSDEDLYKFLKDGIDHLEEYGDLYYSESFSNQKIHGANTIKTEVSDNGGSYLDFSFNMDFVKEEEIRNIIKALKVNKKFYKLKDGSFLNLEELEVSGVFNLLDDLTIDNSSYKKDMKIHKSRVLYLAKELEENNEVKGKDIIYEIAGKIKEGCSISYHIPKELKATLRDYQIEGFKWFKTLSHYGFGGILADEMGLGKTVQTIAFLLSEKGKKSLIITPTSLIYNWKEEFKKFAPSLKVLLLHGNKNEREEAMENYLDYDIILTTYGTLKNDFEFYEDKNFDFSIIDEGQNIKNYSSLSSEAVKSVKANVKFALTGTPIENNLMELWSIFDYVMPGYLYNKTKFSDKFLGKGSNLVKLKAMIKPFILRRLKKDVMLELPDKIEKKFLVEISEEQKKVYKACVEEIKGKLKSGEKENNKITILSYLTKLRQICLEPELVVNNYTGKNGKLEVAMEILKEVIDDGKKILLFSQFTSVLEIIKKSLESEGIEYYYLDGSTKANTRVDMVNSFNEDSDKNIFLISLKAGGTGLNLTSASTVLHFDPWWNPAIEDQATDRAHRMGQKNVVEVIKLIAKGTIEEKIVKLQESKKEIINDIMENGYENGTLLTSLTEKEIMDLFD